MGEKITRTFIVEDHAIFRQTLSKLVDRTNGLSLCGAAETAEAALAEIPECKPELVLVDISLPDMNGIDLIRHLHKQYPALFLLAISGHEEKVYAIPALKAGARGYVMKGKVEKINRAIIRVCRGEIYVSEAIWAKLNEIE
jgi:DNA-binding NarL/FixJ family response regulator